MKKTQSEVIDSPQATNADISKMNEAEIAALQKELARLKEENELKAKIIDKYESKQAGTLIICPNPLADFKMYGLQFRDGICFIPDAEPVEYFEVHEEMPSDAVLWRDTLDIYADDKYADMPLEEKQNYFKNLKAELTRNRAVPSSQRAVSHLVGDFGYTAKRYEREDFDQLKKDLKARHKERLDMEAKKNSASRLADELSVSRFIR